MEDGKQLREKLVAEWDRLIEDFDVEMTGVRLHHRQMYAILSSLRGGAEADSEGWQMPRLNEVDWRFRNLPITRNREHTGEPVIETKKIIRFEPYLP